MVNLCTVGKPRERTPSSALGGLYRFPDDPGVPNTPAPEFGGPGPPSIARAGEFDIPYPGRLSCHLFLPRFNDGQV